MTGPTLIAHPDQADAAWMTTALRASGAIDTAEVTSVDVAAVGTGQVGDSYRFTLSYAGGEGPATIIGKFPSEDPTSREGAVSTRTYEIETSFYNELRDRVAIRTPAPLLSLYDQPSNEFVLLLEDMAPADQGDQLGGCDADTSALAMAEIAKLHAPVWGAPDLEGLPWLNRNTPEAADFTVTLFGMLWPGFLERYSDRVDPDVLEAGTTVIERLGEYLSYRPEPFTAAHGDYRLDNMLFGDAVPLTTVDWQTVALNPGATDVAYFLGTSPTPDVRAATENDLVAEYHGALTAGGVDGYDLDRCRHDVRRFAFAGFLMAVGASMLVGRTDRGDEMFMCMANRSGRMAIENETLSLL